MRTDIADRVDEIRGWIDAKRSKAYMCQQLRCKPDTLNSWLDKLSIVYVGNQGSCGVVSTLKKTFEEYIATCGAPKRWKIKQKLFEEGLKEKRCEQCLNTEWEGKPIPLELHHINGNPFDHKLKNLQILCPNCHSLMPNNAGSASKK